VRGCLLLPVAVFLVACETVAFLLVSVLAFFLGACVLVCFSRAIKKKRCCVFLVPSDCQHLSLAAVFFSCHLIDPIFTKPSFG
jgi:hypothetical protein